MPFFDFRKIFQCLFRLYRCMPTLSKFHKTGFEKMPLQMRSLVFTCIALSGGNATSIQDMVWPVWLQTHNVPLRTCMLSVGPIDEDCRHVAIVKCERSD